MKGFIELKEKGIMINIDCIKTITHDPEIFRITYDNGEKITTSNISKKDWPSDYEKLKKQFACIVRKFYV